MMPLSMHVPVGKRSHGTGPHVARECFIRHSAPDALGSAIQSGQRAGLTDFED